jgi:hypothetical protein
MKLVDWPFVLGYGLITFAFTVCGLTLVGFALLEIWQALRPTQPESSIGQLNAILRSIGLSTVAVTSPNGARRGDPA